MAPGCLKHSGAEGVSNLDTYPKSSLSQEERLKEDIDKGILQIGHRWAILIVTCTPHLKSWILTSDRYPELDETIAHMAVDRNPVHEIHQCEVSVSLTWEWQADAQHLWESKEEAK